MATSTNRSTTVIWPSISYPLYITHYPLIYIHQSWVARYADTPLGRHVFVSVSIFILTILVAYASYRLYDLPVREWLKNRWFKVPSRNA